MNPSKSPMDRDRQRILRLDQGVRVSLKWLLATGLLHLLITERLAFYLGLRYSPSFSPVFRSLGLAEIMSAVYLRRSLDEPEQRYLAVDLLALYFIAQPVFTLHQQLAGERVYISEWVFAAIYLGLGACLAYYRTRSSKMAAGLPGAADAKEATKLAARETIARLKELMEEKKRSRPAPGGHGQDGQPPKKLSEAAPHMD